MDWKVRLWSTAWWHGATNATSIQEEMYYRRQCTLNTITDLQAFFLRAYGAMDEDPEDLKREQTTSLVPSVSQIRNPPRQIQCRWAFGNSSACDAFHLGQMIRFFTVRTKTVFLGSSLIDLDFSLDPDSADSDYPEELVHDNGRVGSSGKEKESSEVPRTPDICSLIGSLRQCPDYQLDASHSGCGIRRRFIPSLDCIEGFVGDGRGLLGIILRLWNTYDEAYAGSVNSVTSPSWASPQPPFRRAHSIDVRLSKISAIHFTPTPTPEQAHPPGRAMMGSTATSTSRPPKSAEEDARLFFTARRRNWEA